MFFLTLPRLNIFSSLPHGKAHNDQALKLLKNEGREFVADATALAKRIPTSTFSYQEPVREFGEVTTPNSRTGCPYCLLLSGDNSIFASFGNSKFYDCLCRYLYGGASLWISSHSCLTLRFYKLAEPWDNELAILLCLGYRGARDNIENFIGRRFGYACLLCYLSN
jgi:hypothetical protein